MKLWTPTSAILDQREAQAASLVALSEARNHLAYWNQKVQEIDPHVQVIKASEHATQQGVKPGYYHLLRIPPDGPPSIVVHEGPNGEYRDADEGLVNLLRESDLWNPRVARNKERLREEAKAALEAEKARERDERREELKDLYKHRFVTKMTPGKSL